MLAYINQGADKRITDALSKMGFEVVLLAPFGALSAPVSSHADMLLLSVGDTLFIVMGKEEAYFHHYHICEDLEDLKDVYPSLWSSIGWIITEQAIREMYETKKQEGKKLQMKSIEFGGDMQ